MCTVQGRPSTVVSLKDWPTVKETWVVRTLVDVLMDRLSPCWVISTVGLEAAVTAIFLRNTFTPVHIQTELISYHSFVTKGACKRPNFVQSIFIFILISYLLSSCCLEFIQYIMKINVQRYSVCFRQSITVDLLAPSVIWQCYIVAVW